MIYTITLNPAIDRTFWIQRIRDDVSNRILEEKSFAGGKSIDVSRVLKNLGIDNTALGFVGGFAGRELEGRLLNDGIQCDFVRVAGETRTNIVLHEKETGNQIVFNARGPEIKPNENYAADRTNRESSLSRFCDHRRKSPTWSQPGDLP